ncbi:DUF3347 domain-containing protein [Aequorivita viscosa]|uniref:DUF3347 domain-containing protein n=1 Tax=Aequorivita viscosa TaxID=797419 RepID=A0A1M6K2W6_9FLAO|nr:DUF3347 domain-containing protein [Aequorivita viscosa]SDW59459.1 Protein of unknown function [Aequorivita viscosa]SHJ53283.1 Protein of unknown function [Aequorivita viscosa]
MKNLSILFLALLSVSLFSCKDNTKEAELEVVTVDTAPESKETYEVAQTDAVFKDSKVEAVFNQYIKVEAALVNTDAQATSSAAKDLESMLKEVKLDEEVQKAVSIIASSDDIKIQRENFEHLSDGIEKMLEGSLESGMLYKQYCPMAFNNRGASWISSSKDILNPYFGDKMLKCGRVDAEIK